MFLGNRLALAAALLLGLAGLAPGADSLSWSGAKSRVTADVQTWDLQTLLENVAGATGWEIYVEPRTRHQASVKFKERAPGEALRLLLGDLSYVLLPPTTNGPGKLYVFRNSKGDATQVVRARKRSKRLENELIVAMKRGAKLDAERLGAKVTGKIDKLNAYRLEFPDAEAADEARKKLEADEDVDMLDSNYAMLRPANPEALPNAIPGLDIPIKPNQAGEPWIIGLIDTAVQLPGGERDAFFLPGISVAGEATPQTDSPTHGTSMAWAALLGASMASDGSRGSNLRIQSVDVYGNSPYTTSFQLANGMMEALAQGADVINISSGSDHESLFLNRVISKADEAGVPTFAAGGNNPSAPVSHPAANPVAIAVAPLDPAGNIAPYASLGPELDVGRRGDVLVPFNGQTYIVIGSSPATARASGEYLTIFSSGASRDAALQRMGNGMSIRPRAR